MSQLNTAGELANPENRGIYFVEAIPDLPDLVNTFTSRGFRVFRVASARDKFELLEAVADALSFPKGFGKNWDALDDFLADMSWAPALGYLLIIEEMETFWHESPEDFESFIGCCAWAAQRWRKDGKAFKLLLRGSAAMKRSLVRSQWRPEINFP